MRHNAQTPRLDGCVRAAWQTQVAAAGQTPGLRPVLLRHRAALLPRFAATYTALQALPRRVRRALHRTWRASLASVALWLVLGQGPVDAATIVVQGACTLVHAIRAANTDTASGGCPAGQGADTIVLPANSTHTLTEVDNSTYGSTGLPVISSPITIMGRGSRIQRASNAPAFRLLAVSSTGELTLQETIVSGGAISSERPYGSQSGGGVWNVGTLALQHSTISGNSADLGGGVANGGGIVTLQYSTIAGNTGGGVANGFGTITLQHSTITGNTSHDRGGGVFNGRAGSTIQHSTISGNSAASNGGGVFSRYGSTIQHSTISGNSAASNGGGVFSLGAGGTLTLQHSTITGNSAASNGGGVFSLVAGGLALARTLVSGNTVANTGSESSEISGAVQANNHNLFGVNGDAGVVGFSPGPSDLVPPPGVVLSDILQPTLAANGGPTLTHALVPGSPALDAIPAADPSCTGTDQRGVPRPQGVGCDIGAVEGGAPTVVNDLVTLIPLPATFQTSTNVSGCPPGFVGTFHFSARLTPQAPSPPLVALVIEVETLSNGNLVQNALGEPQGVGARVPVPLQESVADGLLRPNEAVEVPLVICLRQKTPFQFFVDVLGMEQE